jgi:hypothetical protein
MNLTEIYETEGAPLIFDCPDCGCETEAHLYVDRRDVGSGCSWIICDACPRGYNRGMWEAEDVTTRVKMLA